MRHILTYLKDFCSCIYKALNTQKRSPRKRCCGKRPFNMASDDGRDRIKNRGGTAGVSCLFYKLFLCFSTGLLLYEVLYQQNTWLFVTHVSNIEAYHIVKNSSRDPEDKALTLDPDLILDYDHPGAYWLPSQEVYFSSAFLDTRYNRSTARIIGLQSRSQKMAPHCKFVTVNGSSVLVQTKVELIFPHWPRNSVYHAAMYNCDTPTNDFDRTFIQLCSLANLPCVRIPLNHHNKNKNLHQEHPKFAHLPKRQLAICGKAYTGTLDPIRLIEWFEINRMAGVSTVIVYDNGIRGWAHQVIDHYKSIKFVKTVSFPLLEILHDHAKRQYGNRLSKEEFFSISQQAYLASVNDCLYRYLHRYEFFLIIDYDELLLPYREESLYFMALRQSIQHPKRSGLTFYTAWHFTDFGETPVTDTSPPKTNYYGGTRQNKKNATKPINLYTLTHNRRTTITNNQPKSIVLSDHALTVNWHAVVSNHPMSTHGLNQLIVPATDSAYVHHYRGRCIDKFLASDCDVMLRQSFVDDVLPRYAGRLRSRVKDMYQILGMRTT